MAIARKAIAAALLKQLNIGGQFKKTGRRDRAPENAAQPGAPALYLIKPREKYIYAAEANRGVPPTRELFFWAVIYTNTGTDESAVPADTIDDLLDAIDAALASGIVDQMNNGGRQTLGGLVYDCRIEGEDEIAPGDKQGLGSTLLPIVVTLSQYP